MKTEDIYLDDTGFNASLKKEDSRECLRGVLRNSYATEKQTGSTASETSGSDDKNQNNVLYRGGLFYA